MANSGEAQHLTISKACDVDQQVLVVCANQQAAEALFYSLQFFLPQKTIHLFPEWETLPYDMFSAHESIISERLSLFAELQKKQKVIVIASVHALMNRIAPSRFIVSQCFQYHLNDKVDIAALRDNLAAHGYRCVSQVEEHGDFAIRGAIIDIFPNGSELPYRLELFDDELETIRTFDPDTQLSIEKLDAIHLLPGHEYPLDQASIALFRQNWRAKFSGNPLNCPMYQEISDGIASPGIEYYLPLFFEETASLIDYFDKKALCLRYGAIQPAALAYFQEVEKRFEQLSHDVIRPILKPAETFFRSNETLAKLNELETTTFDTAISTDIFPNLRADTKAKNPFEALSRFLSAHAQRVLFCADSKGRLTILKSLLKNAGIETDHVDGWPGFIQSSAPCAICIAPLEQGEINDDVIIIAEKQLLGEHAGGVQRGKKKRLSQPPDEMSIRSLAELNLGEAIVHIEHGVGRYLGLETIESAHQTQEFLKIEYANDAKLYVPVTSLQLVSRYSAGDSENAPLHTLGTDKWSREKKKAADKARDVAAELLEIYAKREARPGTALTIDESGFALFCSQFPFNETPDQIAAIEKIIEDLKAPRPMDRLLCGDVGFGKTEVAMRAAFIAAMNHKQVAVLAPTTLLVQQHYQTFLDRFADFPIQIGVVSRFVSQKEQTKTLTQLAEGKLDIIIGTHKLLSDDVRFKNLGLLVIDEEHRFGVNQKEKFKAMRAEVDILTMTATPIPRTLNLAFSSLRDLSIIATPPAKRLAVKTFVQKHNPIIIRDAILREILRGGQVYFLHNNVDTIEKTANELDKLVPEARITIGHGQMRERDLEKTMVDFYHRRFNVLVSTTIIETGIDIPTANTIIIDRADKFGLAQLHQLRGRVGRSHHQAYAYLLIPDPKAITKDAQKRLDAIATHEELGAGFMLATHDLEIRGAGELLGENQSGEMHAIGFTLYMEMLERAVDSLKQGKTIDLDQPMYDDIKIELGFSSIIPNAYLPDIHLRLLLYKRIANAKTQEDLNTIKAEMIDRFGTLPEPCDNLFEIQSLKLNIKSLGVEKIAKRQKTITIEFNQKPNIDVRALMKLVQEDANIKMMGPTKIGIQNVNKPIETLNHFFKVLVV